MSRKTASFSQLVFYINKWREENDKYSFSHNIYSRNPYYIIKEYNENYKKLHKQKNSNALYHEIVSLKHQNNLTITEQREILKDLAEEYIKTRANNNLVYGVIHEQHNQVHCHMIISSNEIESNRNKRLSMKQFDEIKVKLREYAYIKYPKLERLINEKSKKKVRAKTRTIDNEIQYKKRTGKQSDREQIHEKLHNIIIHSKDKQSFLLNLENEKLQVYQRWKTFGFLDMMTGKKYRLKTLELEEEFLKLNTKIAKQLKIANTVEKIMSSHYEETHEYIKTETKCVRLLKRL